MSLDLEKKSNLPSQLWIFKCVNFGISEIFTSMVNLVTFEAWWNVNQHEFYCFMQPSIDILNTPSSRVLKDSVPLQCQILRCTNFGICESSTNLFLLMMKLYLKIFQAKWILNEHVIFFLFLFFVCLFVCLFVFYFI